MNKYYVVEDDNATSVFGGSVVIDGEAFVPCVATFRNGRRLPDGTYGHEIAQKLCDELNAKESES